METLGMRVDGNVPQTQNLYGLRVFSAYKQSGTYTQNLATVIWNCYMDVPGQC